MEIKKIQYLNGYEFIIIPGYHSKREPDIKVETQSTWIFEDNIDGSSRTSAIKKMVHGQRVKLAWLPKHENDETEVYIFGGDHKSSLDMTLCIGRIDKYLAKTILEFIHSDICEGISFVFKETAGGEHGFPILGGAINIDIFINNSKVEKLGNTFPICPYCNSSLAKMPLKKTICKACKKEMYSKKMFDGRYILMTDENNNRLMDYRGLTSGLYYNSIK